jgi:biopolymer transport protein ExbD
MKLRKSRTRRRGRIEIIPMIDVMFFLLATFMLASLTMQNLHSVAVNLPKGRAAPLQPKQPVTLAISREGGLFLNETPVSLDTLADSLRAMLAPDGTVIVAADNEAQNGLVVQAMLKAKEAGAERFQIAVKHE